MDKINVGDLVRYTGPVELEDLIYIVVGKLSSEGSEYSAIIRPVLGGKFKLLGEVHEHSTCTCLITSLSKIEDND